MATKNVRKAPLKTHEGAPAKHVDAIDQLRRSVMSTMLWEGTFYEDGEDIATRIKTLASQIDAQTVADIAVEARQAHNLRHASLYLAMSLFDRVADAKLKVDTLDAVIQRPDELTEALALFGRAKKLPNALKAGLAKAFTKFDAYQLAKYANREGEYTLRDVMFIAHPKPPKILEGVYQSLANQNLKQTDTWESRLSAGGNKRQVFEDLLRRNKLGDLALLRNLRGMIEAEVDIKLIRAALQVARFSRVLPFRFVSAAKHAPSLAMDLDAAMGRSLEGVDKWEGTTLVLIDRSASMVGRPVSRGSQIDRLDAASALAVMAIGMSEHARVFSFSAHAHCLKGHKWNHIPGPDLKEHDARPSLSLIREVQMAPHWGTDLGGAVKAVNEIGYDRLIVVTDEQSASKVPDPVGKGAMINVAPHQNGVGYGKWVHVDGFSEAVLKFLKELW